MPLLMNSGNGGPWGGGGSGGDNRGGRGGSPWGSGGGSGGGNGGGNRGGGSRGPGGPNSDDVERMMREGQEKLKQMIPGGGMGGKGIFLIGALAAALWLATGFYTVEPDEQGVELVFGKLAQTTAPGLNYNFPAPVGQVLKPKITVVNQVEVGFSSASAGRTAFSSALDLKKESLMLTGDENIVDVQFVVQWVIDDAGMFLFNVRNPQESVKNAAEAAMREVVGKSEFQFIRTGGRAQIAADAQELLQSILESYGSGIRITSVNIKKADPPEQVIDAFRDVQAANADKERAINEATAYANEITEKALGQSEQITRAAEAYKEEKINQSTGDASRFLQVYEEYKGSEEITKRRIYLQTMEEILADMDKILIEEGENGSGVLPYLPLNELKKK